MTVLEKIENTLNRALEEDKDAITKLSEYRVSCNEKLVDDPTIQVRVENNGKGSVGILGILNGIVQDIKKYHKLVAITNLKCSSDECGYVVMKEIIEKFKIMSDAEYLEKYNSREIPQ